MAERIVIDLSHPIDEDVPMFPGTPPPKIEEFLTREASRAHFAADTAFVIHRYHLIGNTGTYLDSPFHRHTDGADLATLPLDRLVDLQGLVLDMAPHVAAGGRAVDVGDVDGLDLASQALLIRTGWDARWPRPEYLAAKPYLTEAAARHLADHRVALTGIDTWNIDDTGDRRRPVHTLLLRTGIPIVENLRGLGRLPTTGFRFSAAPLPIRGGPTCPVRAYAVVGRG